MDQIEFMDRQLTVAISQPPAHDKSKAPPARAPIPEQKTERKFAPPRTDSKHFAPRSETKTFVPRPDQKSRISFIPASLQKAAPKDPAAPTSTNQPAKSNDDFRKMLMK
jgi:hypothetical protein